MTEGGTGYAMNMNDAPDLTQHPPEHRVGRTPRGGGGAGAAARQENHRQARGEGQSDGGRSW